MELIAVNGSAPKHAKQESRFKWAKAEEPKVISYDPPETEFDQNRLEGKIRTLENENERIRRMYETLEQSYMAKCSEADLLRKQLENKIAKIKKLEAAVLRQAVGE